MTAPLTQIGEACGNPSGSLRQVEILLPEDCSSIPEMLGANVRGSEPVLKAGKSSLIIPFDRFSATLGSRPNTSARGGDTWTHAVECRIRQNRQSVGEWMMGLKNRRAHLITMDWHGIRMFFPNQRAATERSMEARLGGGNAFRFAFQRQSIHPGIYLTPGESVAPITGEGIGGTGSTSANIFEVLRITGAGIPSAAPVANDPRVAVNDAGKMWAWDGTLTAWVSVGGVPNEYLQKINSATGTVINLTIPAPTVNSNLYISVYRDGGLLSYGDDYYLSSSTQLTFYEALMGERLLIITKTI